MNMICDIEHPYVDVLQIHQADELRIAMGDHDIEADDSVLFVKSNRRNEDSLLSLLDIAGCISTNESNESFISSGC